MLLRQSANLVSRPIPLLWPVADVFAPADGYYSPSGALYVSPGGGTYYARPSA